jgi:hypothetical protein
VLQLVPVNTNLVPTLEHSAELALIVLKITKLIITKLKAKKYLKFLFNDIFII